MPTGGGDQVRLLHFQNGKADAPLDVTEPGRDVWRPAVAAAGDGSVVVVWTEKRGDNWDLFSRRYDPAKSTFSPEHRITDQPGPDSDAVATAAADGTVWLAWQSWIGGQADILLEPLDATGKPSAPPVKISDTPANEWAPSIAADSSGRVHVAFDSYQAGNYDVLLRTREPDGIVEPRRSPWPGRPRSRRGPAWQPIRADASGSPMKSARPTGAKTPSTCSTARARACIAPARSWSRSSTAGACLPHPIRSSTRRRSAQEHEQLSQDRRRSRRPAVAGVSPPAGGDLGQQRRDGHRGRLDRTCHVAFGRRVVGPPTALPVAMARSITAPALVQPGVGPVLAFYSTDGRLRREAEMSPRAAVKYFSNQGTPPGVFNVDLEVCRTRRPTAVRRTPVDASPIARRGAGPEPCTPTRPTTCARMRAYRIAAGGKNYRLLRGEFHRHTEISADGGADGSLEDMWRYALDAAALDWIGNGDHDNGGGKEYTWWLIQKTTDLYSQPPSFVPMFTYERSVAYPHGHRNVMFDHRGVRTLPRLVGTKRTGRCRHADALRLLERT